MGRTDTNFTISFTNFTTFCLKNERCGRVRIKHRIKSCITQFWILSPDQKQPSRTTLLTHSAPWPSLLSTQEPLQPPHRPWEEASVLASVSADGSVRIFDLRDKEHSTIKSRVEQARLEVHVDDYKVLILDIRLPTMPVAELERHRLMAIRVVLMV
ncbi:hypothetical protein IGI04_008448 [Brassica rapa subsp. trilocularis]|uniref:Uncharacterized protein n=1 Tax=Brassica rapa subsp. trilocularis TaxID=1813537 RepID=A0ABQ7NMN4_BRACM|nr:hypothetical protein IGI04_008448 [Brassica rapa subsp. trilocularis]